MSGVPTGGGQNYSTSYSFPKDKIKEGWDKGMYITNLTYGDGKWVLVMSGTLF